ncbi:MAG: cell division protein FtsA [Candidatus Staskawiczbacteria bacterium RIFCSPLOWO2_01_FULL_40_39]|uniref:Cell division protein FtsA n=1 Tax=Candidatus Staskawiczbacteria bacterium RIFCSPHIGHO2_01_FULL_39_25 TaxID=1802202 RepID=A0A1G2HNP4_9BACT|nr:MAG: cell division protein FtsA [Candidatus Staskawiczbacteria bacterium RIFCSPHIGHO2_01_FULL_39_25]OGZ73934.1 MAG: cell division protein FtsA [Candidatus Staskawiczbacteria bacterium RIFCSPLOWO2_01_FULL_40_39]
MAKGQIITGLDIGTHTIKILVAQNNGLGWEFLSYSQIPSFGLRRGAVVNVEETVKNIQLLLSSVEKDCGRKINSVFVNIGGSHLYATPSDGLISVSRADHIISQEDIERVLQATRAINIPLNEEILDVFPREFIIDDQKGIKQPLGLVGVRLEAKVILLCYFQSYFINLTQAVLNAKLQIDDIIPSSLAAAQAVLTPQQKEIGVALIDIGSATTSLAVFEEGDLIHFAVFPLGSANITNDIAIGLKTEVAVAEDIKKQHGTCIIAKNDKEKKDQAKKKLEVFDKSYPLSFTKKNLVDIIEPRVSEILDLMQKELKKIGRNELLPGGIVLTGGGAKIPKIKELAKERLKLTCEIGVPRGINGLEPDPALATVAGLVLGSADFSNSQKDGILGLPLEFMKGWGSKMRKMFRVFIP